MATDEQYERSKGYLPPGWTEDMFQNPMKYEEEYDALTDEQFLLIRLRTIGSKPPPTVPETGHTQLPAPCVETIEMMGLKDGWGYTIVRADYQDDSTWSTFQAKFETIIEEQLTPDNGSGIDAVKDTMFFDWVENEERLSGADVDAVRAYCNEPDQEHTLRLMTQPIVLLVDGESMNSLLSYETRHIDTEAPVHEKRKGMPWIWAIDLDVQADSHADSNGGYSGNSLDDGSGFDDEIYDGTLKIAIHSLINEFFPIVAGNHLSMDELGPEEEDEGVWHSII